MEYRTDLAVEYTPPSCHRRELRDGCAVTRLNHRGERYVTIELPALTDHTGGAAAELIRRELAAMLPGRGLVLVVGLGNRSITPDALGPLTADKILATRHIRGELARAAGLEGLRPVAVLAPGVLGNTGVESGEAAEALAAALHPAAVVAVDALAARSLSRLGCTVQLSTAGVSPGEGVGNPRPELSARRLGVPVAALGIPTVVDAASLAADLTGGRREAVESVCPRGASMVVTPREIDLLVERGARTLAMAVNRALNPSLSQEEISLLTS